MKRPADDMGADASENRRASESVDEGAGENGSCLVPLAAISYTGPRDDSEGGELAAVMA